MKYIDSLENGGGFENDYKGHDLQSAPDVTNHFYSVAKVDRTKWEAVVVNYGTQKIVARSMKNYKTAGVAYYQAARLFAQIKKGTAKPSMLFKIMDENHLVWNDHNRAFVRINGQATIFPSFRAAALNAEKRELFGSKHEPCAVIIQPCDEGGNTL